MTKHNKWKSVLLSTGQWLYINSIRCALLTISCVALCCCCYTYSKRGGSFGTKIETSASDGSQLPPSPYFPSIASNNDGMAADVYLSLE